MMLFEVKRYMQPESLSQEVAAAAAGIIDQTSFAQGSKDALKRKLQDVIDLVDHGRNISWVSNGSWSMHQMLEKLLEKTGPAEVWISSYAFSETPARKICDLKNSGVIAKLHCIIDSRVDARSASALTMLRNHCDRLKLTDTHAKVTIIKNDEWFLVAAGSANYTTNKRYEAGFISVNAVTANFHKTWIENELRTI